MAEAVGIASSIAGLLTLIGQVTTLSYTFLSDIRNASKSQKLYLQEICALTEVLLRIEQALEIQDIATFRPSSISNALQDCRELLIPLKTSLERATESSSRIERLKSTLTWPLNGKEVKKVVEMLHRYRGIFIAALSSDTFAMSVATYRKFDGLDREKNHQRILEWLGNPVPPRSPIAFFDSACPGTGQWLIDHKDYLEWRDGCVSTLWCHGKPGVGKTIMTSIILNDLCNFWESPKPSIIYHFCDFSQRKAEKTADLLRSFLRQILHEANPQQLSLLEQRREKLNNPSLKELSKTLLDVITIKANAYLIVDALDEFEDRKALIPVLYEIANAGCKVLVTSRDVPDIRDAFKKERKLEIQASRSDLENFVENRLQECDYYDPLNPNAGIISAIVDQANGMFLLARLLMKHLLSLTNIKQMKQALKSMPSDLADAYESSLMRILGQSPSRANLAMRVIGWITHAERRLKVEELRHALAVEEHSSRIDEENLTSIKVILQVCIGLASINPIDNTIGMIHITAYDYFRHLKERFSDIQLDMARTSMSYLGFHPLYDGMCRNVESLQKRFRDMPFLGYAAEHWGDHARPIEQTLERQILEVLNASGIRASSFQALQYRELKDPKLAEATFETLPTGLEALHVAVYWNLASTIESFLKNGVNPSMPDAQGWTALHWACSQGCKEAVELLLKYRADINATDHSGWTPLFWATIKGHRQIVTRLLQDDAKHRLKDTNGWTVLHWAASRGDSVVARILLDHHSEFIARHNPIDVWIKDVTVERAKQLSLASDGISKVPLEIAADKEDVYTFDTILQDLAAKGSVKSFNELWEQKGFDEPRVSIPWRVMTKADRFDNKGLERWDINRKVDSSTDWKIKLLHGAIRDGKPLIVKLLAELGVDLQCRYRGKTPLQQAASLEDPEIAEILLANGASGSGNKEGEKTPLHLAVAFGFKRTAEVLLQGGADINARDDFGRTPLMTACEISRKDGDLALESLPAAIVKMLIDHGADMHATDQYGYNSLHLAVQSLRPDAQIVKLLLQGGIDANLRDDRGYAPLHHFSMGSRGPPRFNGEIDPNMKETLDLLLANSATTTGAENLGLEHRGGFESTDTPLALAIQEDNWQVFHLLLEKGAILATTEPLDSLLCIAAGYQALQPKAVEVLLTQKTDAKLDFTSLAHRALGGLFNEDASTLSPLDDFKSILKMYIDAGLDIDGTNDRNESLLQSAIVLAKEPHESAVVQYLIEVGADVYRPVFGTWDAFMLAAVHGKFSALAVLVAHAAENRNSKHWLQLAEPNNLPDKLGGDGAVEAICASLARNNLIDSKNESGLTPLQKAVELGNTVFASKLLFHGADPTITDEFGWTLLHTAIYAQNEAMARLLVQDGIGVKAASREWAHIWVRPSQLGQGNEWKGTALHLAAMFGQHAIVGLLLEHGADVHADTGCLNGSAPGLPGHGPTALHIALDTGIFYGGRVNLGPDMLKVAEKLVESGATVQGVADHIVFNDVLKFEGFESLWEQLRKGITANGRKFSYLPDCDD